MRSFRRVSVEIAASECWPLRTDFAFPDGSLFIVIQFLSITRDPDYARRLWALEGNTVFVDLERAGKAERQAARSTVISAHTLDAAAGLARLPNRGPLLVRTDPVEAGGDEQAARLAELGVDRVMLPMFRTRDEVDRLVEALERAGEGRVKLSLLAETDDAVGALPEILADQPPWLDHVHIGLNDLSLDRGTAFLFKPLATGEIERLSEEVRDAGRRFGFGGVGLPGRGLVPAERILGEHVRVHSDVVILARSFHQALDATDPDALADGVADLREWERRWRAAGDDTLEENHQVVASAIRQVLQEKGETTPEDVSSAARRSGDG